MDKIALNIGPLSITWYSIFILAGVITAYLIISKESKKHGISDTFITNLIFWCVCFGILGARIYYVLFNLDYYISEPYEIIKIWNGGLAIHGGLIAGLITMIIYCRKYKIDVLLITDICAPALLIAQSIGRWGNFFNQEAHGSLVSQAFLQSLHIPKFVIDGMNISGVYYHPTFLYESLLCALGFLILIIVRKFVKVKKGNITSCYFIWYGIVRFFIESLRTDSLMLLNIKVAQLVSIIMVLLGILMIIVTSIKNDYYDNEEKVKNIKKNKYHKD